MERLIFRILKILSPFIDRGSIQEKKSPKNIISETTPTQHYQTEK